ncbi:hypothetical protein, partial [Candidatus Burkholderia verschuerenii]|uniref:hypothetical protein n=1 Tax=Candidatus Burkholderia verschuerenii TaxID=242163 RepID=UPI000A5CAC42
LPFAGPAVGRSSADQLIRTAVYGPVRTVVWEGSGREACPYPDLIFKMSERRTGNGAPFAHVSAGRIKRPGCL